MDDIRSLERKLERAQGIMRLYRWCLVTAGLIIAMLTVLLVYGKAPQLGRAILVNDQVVAVVRSEKAAAAVRKRLLARAGPGTDATFREKWEDVTRPVDGAPVLSIAEAAAALKGKVTVVKEAFSIECSGRSLAIVPTKAAAQRALDSLKAKYASPNDAVVRTTKLRPEPVIRPCTALPDEIIADETQILDGLTDARPRSAEHTVRPGEYPARIAAAYDMDLTSLMRMNPSLSGRELRVGQRVKVLSKSRGLTVVTVKESVTTEPIPVPMRRKPTDALARGQKKVTVAGKPGRKRVRWEIVMNNDREVSRRSLKEEAIQKPEPGVVLIGTAPAPQT